MDNSAEPPVSEAADASAPNRPKRSRTGCLTCRTRRRKCDEGKPICQNCVSKGLECRYAAAFQILGKNNFTPEVATNVKYTNLRFIPSDADQHPEDTKPIPTSNSKSPPSEPSPNIPIFSPQDHHQIQQIPQLPHPNKSNDTQDPQSQPQPPNTSPNSTYQFALHGLLALGTANPTNIATDLSFSPIPASVSASASASGDPLSTDTPNSNARPASGSQSQDHLSLDTFSPQQRFTAGQVVEGWQLGNVADNPGFEELPHAQVLELLKGYRYGVAPWIDICDMHQCFGCEVLQLSSDSTAIRYGIMALAEVAQQTQHENNVSHIAFLADLTRQRDHGKQSVAISAVLDILSITRTATANLSMFWLQEEDCTFARTVLDNLLPEISSSRLASCAYWFLVRLQLSTTLISSFPVRIPLPFLNQDSFTSSDHDIAFRYANDAVALCVDAAMFCQGDDDKWLQQRYGQNRVEVWKTLIQGFSQWYIHRPQEFQPIIELYSKDGFCSDDEFPTIIFTGGASVVANQLYHTGMLLLLQSKPRFAEQPKSNSPSMSALWHTHRICGTAINNDRREYWDPCLIASLMLAARRATHQSQHTAIINTIENVQRLTGWNVNHHLTNLRNEWQMAEGW